MLAFGDSVYQREEVSLSEDTPVTPTQSVPPEQSAPVENPVVAVVDQMPGAETR